MGALGTSLITSSRFAASFQGIKRLGSAFFNLRRFKLVHICIQVTSLYKTDEIESIVILNLFFYLLVDLNLSLLWRPVTWHITSEFYWVFVKLSESKV